VFDEALVDEVRHFCSQPGGKLPPHRKKTQTADTDTSAKSQTQTAALEEGG
jgi:hypothetical protein